jgi:beta-galactosidase
LLPEISKAHPTEWVSLSWPAPRTLSALRAYFATDAQRVLPSAVEVSAWDGSRYVPVSGLHADWATASNQPSTIAFDELQTSSIRLKMTTPFPNAPNGFFQIAELEAVPAG